MAAHARNGRRDSLSEYPRLGRPIRMCGGRPTRGGVSRASGVLVHGHEDVVEVAPMLFGEGRQGRDLVYESFGQCPQFDVRLLRAPGAAGPGFIPARSDLGEFCPLGPDQALGAFVRFPPRVLLPGRTVRHMRRIEVRSCDW